MLPEKVSRGIVQNAIAINYDCKTMIQAEKTATLVERAVNAGWMSKNNGNFHPEQVVTRTELAKTLVKAFNLDKRTTAEQSDIPVKDLSSDRPDCAAIQLALKTGTLTADSEGRVFPDREVTRAEGFAIFAQAYGVFQLSNDAVNEIFFPYPDADEIPDWAKKAMATALQEGFVNTDANYNIHPSNPMTRSDLAFALNKYLEKQQKPA